MKKKYLVEVIGTFVLSLIVALALVKGYGPFTALIAAITVGVMVYTFGHLSGAHFNPAVTIGAFSIRKISAVDAVMYIIAQAVGVALAVLVMNQYQIVVPDVSTGTNAISIEGWGIAFAEGLGMIFFGFGLASVMYRRVDDAASGITIGGSLLIGLLVASTLGAIGIINPAIDFILHAVSFSYILAPIVGSIIGMQAYHWLSER